jgi:anhydro-N-acetylmuramic acid kinase
MPDEVILGGGGAKNPILLALLREALDPIAVTTHEALGIPDDAKEALAFAVLAYETLHGRAGNLPNCTGASRRTVLGKITLGANCQSLVRTMRAR